MSRLGIWASHGMSPQRGTLDRKLSTRCIIRRKGGSRGVWVQIGLL